VAGQRRAWCCDSHRILVFLNSFSRCVVLLCRACVSVAAGFDRLPLSPSASLSFGSAEMVNAVAPHEASVRDMEVYTCALEEGGKKSSSSTKQRTYGKSNGLGAHDNGQGEKKASKKCLF
jgi:hypothetical protein